jgi:8-oxo-dGTP pyrophosphatase MutT (NUDIX family)
MNENPKRRKKETSNVEPYRNSLTPVAGTKWMSLSTIEYTDEKGEIRKWDNVTRNTSNPDTPDAVFVIPILHSNTNEGSVDTLLVQQYRPPLDAYSMEFPAGLIDKGETAETAGLRELKEETGYVGTIDTNYQCRDLCTTPGITNESCRFIVVNVDLDNPQNVNPKQQLEDGEAIVTKRVPLTAGLKEVFGNLPGLPISNLYSFALGLEIGAKYIKKESAK